MSTDIVFPADPNVDDRLESLWPLLKRRLRLVEGALKNQPFERQLDVARGFHSRFVAYGKRTFFQAVYLGMTFKLLLAGRSERDQERICEQVGHYSLSSARRFVRLVDNLPLIVTQVQEQGLVLEELSPSRLLEFVPKQEGKGGRPRGIKKGASKSKKSPPDPNAVEQATPRQQQPVAPVADVPTSDSSKSADTAPSANGDESKRSRIEESQGEDQDSTLTTELTVTILSEFRPRVPLRELMEKLANRQATLRLGLSLKAVSADESETILGEGEADEIIQYRWSEAVSQDQDAEVLAAESATKDQTPPQEPTVPDDKDKYF